MASVMIDAFHHQLLVVLIVATVIGTDHSPAAVTRIKHTEMWCFLWILAIILIGPG